MSRKSFDIACEIFRQHNGLLRVSQAKLLGIAEPIIVQMTDAGLLVREGRGLYRLAEQDTLDNPDLVHVAMKIPNSVICLISALSFHNLTTQIPYQVYVALPQGQKSPRINYPPLNIVHLSNRSYHAGIEEHGLDNVTVRVYSREKTVADCFKFRGKIGDDIAIEALKDYLRLKDRDLIKLQEYARVDRVERVMRPYLEASL